MDSILYSIIIPIISVLIILFLLNYLLKKNLENYGVYCGIYNTKVDKYTAQMQCSKDVECTWNSNLAYCTNRQTNTIPNNILAENYE